MTPLQMKKWQKSLKLSAQQAAAELGINQATFYNYINGKGKLGIPYHIDLACNAVAHGLSAYSLGMK